MKAMRIGGRLRRLSQERRLTQAQMARELGISASYLTLLESNQRPVTVRVLLRLVEKFHVDLKEFAADTDQRLSLELMEAFSDPIFEKRRGQGQRHPGAGRDAARRRPRRSRSLRLPTGATARSTSPTAPATTPPSAAGDHPLRGSDRIHPAPPEPLSRARRGGRAAVGRARPRHSHPAPGPDGVLRQRYSVEVEIRPADRCRAVRAATTACRAGSRFPRCCRREPRVPDRPPDRLPRPPRPSRPARRRGQLLQRGRRRADAHGARQLFRRRGADALPAVPRCGQEGPLRRRHPQEPLRRVLRAGLPSPDHAPPPRRGRRAASTSSASTSPATSPSASRPRASTSPASAPPARAGTSTTPSPRPACCACSFADARRRDLLLHRPHHRPHQRLAAGGGLPHRVGQRAVGLGCDVRHASEIVYADGLNLADPQIITPIGVSCRTCPRTDCAERAMPSLHQRCTSTRTCADLDLRQT